MMETFKKIAEKFKDDKYIEINPKDSTIKFKIQDGPIGEEGVNGTQIDEINEVYISILEEFNSGELRNRYNSLAITDAQSSGNWLMRRTKDREKRGVEGFNKK